MKRGYDKCLKKTTNKQKNSPYVFVIGLEICSKIHYFVLLSNC